MAYKRLPSIRKLRQLFVVNRRDGILVKRALPPSAFPTIQAWYQHTQHAGKPCASIRGGKRCPYLCVSVGGRDRYMVHRIIWKMVTGKEPRMLDHIDGDPTNNRFENLRECTTAQNSQNSWGRRRGKLKGASWFKGAWQSQIEANGERYYLGRFATAKLAHAAYVKAAKRLHGEFANSGHVFLASGNDCNPK